MLPPFCRYVHINYHLFLYRRFHPQNLFLCLHNFVRLCLGAVEFESTYLPLLRIVFAGIY